MEQTVNERVKVLRTHLNLTQQAFAELVGITSTQLSRIESGDGTPQKSTIQKIVEHTGVPNDWINSGKGELKAQVKMRDSQAANNLPWKEEAYSELKQTNSYLQKKLDESTATVSRLLDMIGSGNFLQLVNETALKATG